MALAGPGAAARRRLLLRRRLLRATKLGVRRRMSAQCKEGERPSGGLPSFVAQFKKLRINFKV